MPMALARGYPAAAAGGRRGSLLALLAAAIIPVLVGAELWNGRDGLMWSARPLTDCRLDESGVWINIPDTSLTVVLENEASILVSYSMVVNAAQSQVPGSSFLTDQQHNGGNRDVLQIRLLVNGVPLRQSSSHTSAAGSYETFVDTLGGHVVTELGPGNHTVGLQWKKSAGGTVTSWSTRPSSHDGHTSGRSVVVTAQASIATYGTQQQL
ncbi:unnamed protein product [Discosporangium mesarthrocarpum]